MLLSELYRKKTYSLNPPMFQIPYEGAWGTGRFGRTPDTARDLSNRLLRVDKVRSNP